MSEAQVKPGSREHWRSELEPASNHSDWTPQSYSALVSLIQHCDHQMGHTNRYYMTAIGSLIPVLAVLLKVQVPMYSLIGLMLLGVALSIRWLTQSSKLNLEKLCWVSLARVVEGQCLREPVGPFTAQQEFFSVLPPQVGNRDTFIMRKVGTRRLYLISILVLCIGLLATALTALSGHLN